MLVPGPIDPAPGTLPHSLGHRAIVAIDDGGATLEYECSPAMCHSGGVAQGGFVAGWIDAAMAHAVMARHGVERVPISLELKVSYFAPANPGRVLASARIVHGGGRTVFAEGELHDGAGKLLARATSTITLIDAKKVAGTMAGG